MNKKEKERHNKARRKLVLEKKCVDCSTPLTRENYNGATIRCDKCNLSGRKSSKKYKNKRRSLGLCPICGKSKERKNLNHCDSCIKSGSKRRIFGRRLKTGNYIDIHIKDYLKQFMEE